MAYLTALKTHYSIKGDMRRLSFIFLSLLLLFFSCKKHAGSVKFFSQIKVIDSYILQDERDRALSSLIALSSTVQDARQVLAVAKRMLQINATPEIIKFLQTVIPEVTDSPEVAGLLISTLIDAGHVENVDEYAVYVKNSAYASLVAESSAFRSDGEACLRVDPRCWEEAYRLTGMQCFLKVASLIFCKEGKLSQAEFLRESISKDVDIEDPFFWACVSYDLGHFDFVFKSVESSVLNAENQGVFEIKNVDVDKASRHLLLAADAAYGTGDIDIARSYWLICADMPRPFPVALYNLALTSENEEEKAKFFVECITKYPSYYPAVSSYIRQYLTLKENEISDDVTKYLAERGFYSMKMEDVYLSLPNMVYSPETLLKVALGQKDSDPRIAVEYFRYKHYQGMDFRSGIADMWKLLEDYPDSADIKTYAKWYFSHCRDFNACFSVGDVGDEALDAFYLGLEKAIKSSTDDDIIESFEKAATVKEYKVFSTANIAYIYYKQGMKDKAIETLALAASMTDEGKVKSRLHYQLAKILSEVKSYERAISVLGYAIEVDPTNYPAQVLLEKLQSLR